MRRSLAFLLLLVAAPAGAQSAVDFYHDAARLYIAEDNAQAERAAEAGLALAPDDQKLQALLEKIRERNEQEEQQGGGEPQQDDAEDQQQGEGEQQQDENESGQPQPGEEGEEQETGQQQPSEGEDQSQQQPEGPTDEPPRDEREGNTGQEGEPNEGTPQEGGGNVETPYDVKPGEMSRAEAERILRAIQSDELELLRDVQRRRARPRYVEKDW